MYNVNGLEYGKGGYFHINRLKFILRPLYSILIWIISLCIVSIVISTIISYSFKNTLFITGLIFLCISVILYIDENSTDIIKNELKLSFNSLILVISGVISMLISHFVL